MLIASFAKECKGKLRERMNELADYLSGGNAKSYDDYKALCGEIKGLAIAEAMVLEAAEIEEKILIND